MKVTVKGIDKTLDDLAKQIESKRSTIAETKATSLMAELALATPVKTGLAMSSWVLRKLKDGDAIVNTVPYVAYLNNGSSKQAPAHFVETIALKYGKAKGAIIRIIPDGE